MSLETHLRQYYPFDDEVIAAVNDVAAQQDELSFRELADQYNLADGPQRTIDGRTQKPLEFLHIEPPHGEYDHRAARVYYTPMGIATDESIAMRAIRLFAAEPSTQLFVYGSPAAVGNRANCLTAGAARAAVRGDFTGTVAPTLRHLGVYGIDLIDTVGFSYGADRAASAAAEAPYEYGIRVQNGVWMEPAAVAKRSLLSLAHSFARSGAALDQYIQQSASPALLEARQQADTGFTRYALGLLRASNLAIAAGLATNSFTAAAHRALDNNKHMHAAVIQGTASELTPTKGFLASESLHQQHQERAHILLMDGMHHAGGDDINLHTAMVLQGLRVPSSV